MAAVIKASCPACGEVKLTPKGVSLHVCYEVTGMARYLFICPRCGLSVSKPADDHIIMLLVGGGVSAQPWKVPAEALEPHDGPPICYDDLLNLHIALNRD